MTRINQFGFAISWIPLCILFLFTRSCDAVADLLFLDTVPCAELGIALMMGFTAEVASPATWASKDVSDFAKYKAIILGDPNSSNLGLIQAAVDSRAKWSKALKGGRIVVLG